MKRFLYSLIAYPKEPYSGEEDAAVSGPKEEQHNYYFIADGENIDNYKIDEHVPAKYESTHTYLDSILSRVDTKAINNETDVEFPEFGKVLKSKNSTGDLEPGHHTELKSRTWGDNWVVEGVTKFEDQVYLDAADVVSSPKVVPFLIPSSKDARVIIGDRDLDNVSELSEKMSVTSSSSSSTLEMPTCLHSSSDDDDVIDASMCNVMGHEGLQFVQWPVDTSVEEGKIIVMTCEVKGEKPIDICWFFDDRMMTDSSGVRLAQTGNIHTLMIFSPGAENSGLYSIAASNKRGQELWHPWRLTVTPSLSPSSVPTFIKSPASVLEISQGHNLEMEYQVTGYPEPRLDFFKNGKLLRNNEMYTIGEFKNCFESSSQV